MAGERKHTALPWRRGQMGNLRIYGPDGQGRDSGLIAEVFGRSDGSGTENCDLMIRACNSHYPLLEALVEARRAISEIDNSHPVLRTIRAAITAAKPTGGEG